MTISLGSFRPPDRKWLVIEAALLILALIAALVIAFWPQAAETETRVEPVEPPESSRPLDDADRARITELFPARPPSRGEVLLLLERLRVESEACGLSVTGSSLETGTGPAADGTTAAGPEIQPIRWSVTGPTQAHVAFLSVLGESKDGLRIRDLDWTAGPGAEQRSLSLLLELWVAADKAEVKRQ